MKNFLLAILIFVFQPPVPEKIGSTVIHGELTEGEKTLLLELEKRMIPLPDTIKVQKRDRDNGYTKMNGTVILSSDRHRTPEEADGEIPYLYGRKVSQGLSLPLPGSVHTLSHEIAHYLHFRVFNGRSELPPPEYWKMKNVIRPRRAQVETEVDLMAAALQSIVFGRDSEELGYPKEIWDGNTDSLVTKYEARIKDFYRVVND